MLSPSHFVTAFFALAAGAWFVVHDAPGRSDPAERNERLEPELADVEPLVVDAKVAEFAPADPAPTEPGPDDTKAYHEEVKKQARQAAEMGKKATHTQVAEVKVTGTDGKTTLQTLCLDADGRVLALVAPARGYGAPIKDGFGEVHVFSPDGKPVTHWRVHFHAHSINTGPDGTVYVAGDAKVARFDKAGKRLGEPVELSHVAELFKDKDAMRKKAEEQLKKQKESMAKMYRDARKQFEEKIRTIEAKAEADRSKTEKRQLEQYKSVLKAYESAESSQETTTVESILASMAGRLRIINGVAASDADVFVACGEAEGYGYAVYRMDRDLKNPTKVLSGLGGCCGQMDIQCCGADLLVAENTKHQFARYTREGKPVGAFGKRSQDTDPAGFGGCCNPMNVRACGAGGDVLTAESEGFVKRFSPAGEFKGVVGTVKIQGGCKNVAIGVSADGGRVYFCDQPGSRFFVLARKDEKK